jgi:hypothetical protein
LRDVAYPANGAEALHQQAPESTARAVMKVEHAWLDALQRRDVKRLARILAGEVIDITIKGKKSRAPSIFPVSPAGSPIRRSAAFREYKGAPLSEGRCGDRDRRAGHRTCHLAERFICHRASRLEFRAPLVLYRRFSPARFALASRQRQEIISPGSQDSRPVRGRSRRNS